MNNLLLLNFKDNVRFNLCPSFLKDSTFWKIYFLLIKNKLSSSSMKVQSNKNINKEIERNHLFQSPIINQKNISTMDSLSPILGKNLFSLSLSSPSLSSSDKLSNSTENDIEKYFDNLIKEDLNNSLIDSSNDEFNDPSIDNYFSFPIKKYNIYSFK